MVDDHVSSYDSNLLSVLSKKISILLVAERLDGSGIDDALLVLNASFNRIFGDDRFPCSGRSSDNHGVLAVNGLDCLCLKGIEGETFVLHSKLIITRTIFVVNLILLIQHQIN